MTSFGPTPVPPRLTLTARIEALEGESRLQNNSSSVETAVYDQRERVVVLAGEGSRDANECQDALKATPWAEVTRILPVAGTVKAMDVEPFRNADMIVLSDVFGDAVPEAAWAAIDRAVRTDGKSLLVLAGQGEWLGDPTVARHLASLLPTTAGAAADLGNATESHLGDPDAIRAGHAVLAA